MSNLKVSFRAREGGIEKRSAREAFVTPLYITKCCIASIKDFKWALRNNKKEEKKLYTREEELAAENRAVCCRQYTRAHTRALKGRRGGGAPFDLRIDRIQEQEKKKMILYTYIYALTTTVCIHRGGPSPCER